jgi:hypothetical protein
MHNQELENSMAVAIENNVAFGIANYVAAKIAECTGNVPTIDKEAISQSFEEIFGESGISEELENILFVVA